MDVGDNSFRFTLDDPEKAAKTIREPKSTEASTALWLLQSSGAHRVSAQMESPDYRHRSE